MFNVFTEVIFFDTRFPSCANILQLLFGAKLFFLIIITGSTTTPHKNNPYGDAASKQTSDQMFAMAPTCRRRDF